MFGRRRFGEKRARRYASELRSKLLVLLDHPGLGPPAEEVSSGLRRYTYISHIAFYRIETGEIRVVRILHQHMRVEDHFR